MALLIDLPLEIEDVLRMEWGDDLERAAKEALLIESYRTGKITVGVVARLLGLNRWETESWLGEHGVHWNYDIGDLEDDWRTLEEGTH
jgi:predicted HTH domain antitoxin